MELIYQNAFPKKREEVRGVFLFYNENLRARWEEAEVTIQPLNGFDEVFKHTDRYCRIERTRHLKTIGDFQIAFDFCVVRPLVQFIETYFHENIYFETECKCYRFLTSFSEIQVGDSNLSIEHLLSLTAKRFSYLEKASYWIKRGFDLKKGFHLEKPSYLERHINDIMEALYKNDVKSTDEDVAQLLKYVGNPKYLELLRPGLRGLCVKNIHDLKNWFCYYKKSALLPSEIKALFVIDKYQNLRLCLSSRHVFCANGEAVFAAGEITFEVTESPKTLNPKRLKMDIRITNITNKSWDYRPSLDSWAFVDAALRELEIDFPDGFTKEYVYTRCSSFSEN